VGLVRHSVRFLLITLDNSAPAVLRYSFLRRQNPLIDWVSHEILFRSPAASSPPVHALRSPNASLTIPGPPSLPNCALPRHGSSPSAFFTLSPRHHPLWMTRSPPNTQNFGPRLPRPRRCQYTKGTTLPPRRPHDPNIDFMDDTSPPCDPIYSLSEVEQLALPEFLDENLMNQFHLSHSSTDASRPFYQEGRSQQNHQEG
jgi:hypothetical protein